MTKHNLTKSSLVAVSPNQVSTDLGSETVILGVEAGRYFGLDEVGARVWELLQEPISVAAVCETLLSEYEVSASELEHDVLSLLNELSDKGLIDVRSAEGAV